MNKTETQDDYGTFVGLFTQHEAGLRAFIRSLLPDRNSVDDILQEASLVMWQRFETFEPGTNFLNWACTVARFKVLHHRRRQARDRLKFDDDVIALIAEETEAQQDQLERERHALRGCVEALDDARQKLVARCYLQGTTIKQTAAEIGKSPTALYKSLARIRQTLLECIRLRLAEGGCDD